MPLLADAEALRDAVDRIAEWAEPRKPDLVLGAEARGYITGGALACRLGCGFVAARKPGKLPWRTVAAKYALEYGFDSLEVHADAIVKGQRVVIHDDVLATGGTAKATVELVEQLGGEVVGPAVHHRARVPERPRAAPGLRRLLAPPVLGDVRRADGAVHVRMPGPRRDVGAALVVPPARAPAGRVAPGRVPGRVRVSLRRGASRAGRARRPRLGAARARQPARS